MHEMGGGIQTSASAELHLLATCKKICSEAKPSMLAELQLNIVYMSRAPGPLAQLPPRWIRRSVRHIRFCCPHGSGASDPGRPPKLPFPFHNFSKLTTFTVCRDLKIDVTTLVNSATNEQMTKATYDQLSPEEKSSAWRAAGLLSAEDVISRVAAFGRGGWLSRVVDPKNVRLPVNLEADSDPEDDHLDWDEWTYGLLPSEPDDEESGGGWDGDDIDHGYTNPPNEEIRGLEKIKTETEASMPARLKKLRDTVARMQTLIETNTHLVSADDVLDKWFFIIDVASRAIIEIKQISEEEQEERHEWTREATPEEY
jgi:hypothetical protein